MDAAMRAIVVKTEAFAKKHSPSEGSHDWHHVERVLGMSRFLQSREGGDLFVIEMAALLHDIDDWKFSDGNLRAEKWLSTLKLPRSQAHRIMRAIGSVSFKGAKVKIAPSTVEGKIVQDADRLDAVGAIGIARCFAYGGYKGHAIYDPSIKPVAHSSFSQYKNSKSTSINHFYEKLLLLKKRMNTKTAMKIAQQRHAFMEKYLAHFFDEMQALR